MISVIIPTYKNNEQFLANLKHNLPYLKDCEIIAVNDNPVESLKNLIDSSNKIILIENKKNLGFGQTVNCGVKKTKGEFIMLLNDDVKLLNNNYQSAINYFKKNNSLFAVSFAQKEKNGTIVGKNKTFWKNGLFFHQKAEDLTFGETAWAEGGSCMIDREKFLKLGGFDSIYSPFYWEDIDLSYCARKAGYKIIFDPEIEVIHHHESTIGKYYPKGFIKTIAFRNQFLFIWKNASVKEKLIHFLFLPFNIVYYSFKLEGAFTKGLLKALRKYFLS